MIPFHSKGFTLIEAMVAVTLLSLAILAPFEAVQRVMSASRIAKDQLIASSLAQEGLEYARFVRTSNYIYAYKNGDLGSYDIIAGLDGHSSDLFGNSNCMPPSSTCTIDPSKDPASAIKHYLGVPPDTEVLYFNSAGGYYNQSKAGTATPFKRYLTLKTGTGYEIVTVTVTWSEHGIPVPPLILTQRLYDWL